jgi:hypothetical protein
MAPRTKAATAAESQADQHQGNGSPEAAGPPAGEVVEAQRAASTVAVRNDAAMQTFVGWCVQRAETTDEDQYNIMASVVAEIMSSNNVADLMQERAPLHARDIIGVPLLLYGFEIREGKYEDSMIGFYAAMTCGRPGSDETRIVTCGGIKVMAKLYKLEEFINSPDNDESWPQVFWFTEKQTSKGYGVLDIARPEVTL